MKAASPSESAYAGTLRKALRTRFGDHVVDVKVHGGPYQETGVSDLLLCLHGEYIALELKRRGNRATPNQKMFIRRVRHAGGRARVVYTDEPIEGVIKFCLA